MKRIRDTHAAFRLLQQKRSFGMLSPVIENSHEMQANRLNLGAPDLHKFPISKLKLDPGCSLPTPSISCAESCGFPCQDLIP